MITPADHYWLIAVSPTKEGIMLEREPVRLLYCEYDRKRIRNEVDSVEAFDLSSWLWLVGGCVAATWVHGIRIYTESGSTGSTSSNEKSQQAPNSN